MTGVYSVATTSLPAVYHLNGLARTMTAGTPHARAKKLGLKKIPAKGALVIASSRPPERRPLERRTLVPITISIMFSTDTE